MNERKAVRLEGGEEQSPAPGLRKLAASLGVLFLLVVALNLQVNRLSLDLRGSEWAVALLGLLIAGGMVALRGDPNSRVGTAAAGIGVMVTFSILGAVLSMVVLRWGMPQADMALLAADARIGMDVPGIIELVSQSPLATTILQKLYGTSIPLLLLATMVLGLAGQSQRMWRACALFGGCLLTVCLGSGLVPAKGAFLFLDPATIARLPANAGTYAFETFDLWSAGTPAGLSLATLNGVACFPSFHTAAALILCQCGWSSPRLRAPLTLWGGLVILSTIPIGGHYVVDILAGAAVFAAWSRLTRPREAGKVTPSEPVMAGALAGA